jgi:hypothetical protein
MKPLLFLDVDGVINACDPSLDVETIEREGFKIRFQPWLRECLLELHEHFEVVWMTTWREKAEPSFADVLGLPGQRAYVPWADFKIPALLMYACDRPWAFVDDDATWELEQLKRRGISVSTGLIVVPDAEVGLAREHTHMLVAWAEAQC